MQSLIGSSLSAGDAYVPGPYWSDRVQVSKHEQAFFLIKYMHNEFSSCSFDHALLSPKLLYFYRVENKYFVFKTNKHTFINQENVVEYVFLDYRNLNFIVHFHKI